MGSGESSRQTRRRFSPSAVPSGLVTRDILLQTQYVAEKSSDFPAIPCKIIGAPSREGAPERWPSGLRRTLGKRVCGKPYRGFESHSLRQSPSKCKVDLCFRRSTPRLLPGATGVGKRDPFRIRSRSALDCVRWQNSSLQPRVGVEQLNAEFTGRPGGECGSEASAACIQRGPVRCRYRWRLLRQRPARCRNAGESRAQSACSRESRRRRQYR